MNKAEQNILTALRAEIQEVREEERSLTLHGVQNMLCWLSIDPPMSREKLMETCLAEFERANRYDSKSVNEVINHYRKVANNS